MLSGCDRVKPAVYGCSSGIRVSANLIVVGESLVLFFAVRPGGPDVDGGVSESDVDEDGDFGAHPVTDPRGAAVSTSCTPVH